MRLLCLWFLKGFYSFYTFNVRETTPRWQQFKPTGCSRGSFSSLCCNYQFCLMWKNEEGFSLSKLINFWSPARPWGVVQWHILNLFSQRSFGACRWIFHAVTADAKIPTVEWCSVFCLHTGADFLFFLKKSYDGKGKGHLKVASDQWEHAEF